MISKRSAEPGQLAGPSAAVLTVISLDSVFFEAQVPETDIGALRIGQTVEVSVDAFPGQKFPGRVAKIYPSGSTSSRSFVVRVAVPNRDGRLRPAMFAPRQCRPGTAGRGPYVSKDALVRTDSGTVIFIAVWRQGGKETCRTGTDGHLDG